MKQIQKYLCGVCGSEHTSERKAAKCEKSHLLIKEVKPYVPCGFESKNKGKIPMGIIVTFENGFQECYELPTFGYRINLQTGQRGVLERYSLTGNLPT